VERKKRLNKPIRTQALASVADVLCDCIPFKSFQPFKWRITQDVCNGGYIDNTNKWTRALHTLWCNFFNTFVHLMSHKTNHRKYNKTSKNTGTTVGNRDYHCIPNNTRHKWNEVRIHDYELIEIFRTVMIYDKRVRAIKAWSNY